MGEYVESITYRADIDEVKRKLRDLKGSVDDTQVGHNRAVGFMDRAWSGLKGTISSAVALAARAGTAIAGGLAVAGGFGLKLAGDFQQTTIAFEGILGSADKAKTFLAGLRDFAAKTPFEFPGLADAAKNLLAVGFATDDVLPTMTTLGNVAATLGVGETEIQGVVRALGQMKGKGKASAEELQQISEQIPGFSAIKAIADGMGVSVADAFDLVAKGAVPADDAINFILAGMEKFPGASGAMERQSKTLNGVLSTFKDTIGNLAIDFITPYLPAISAGIESVAGWLQSTGAPAFQRFARSAGTAIGQVVGWVRDHWPEISETVGEVLDRVMAAVDIVVEFVRAHWPEISRTISEVIDTVVTVVSGAVELIQTLWANFGDNILSFVNRYWPNVLQVIDGVMRAIQGVIDLVLGIITGDWGRAWDGIKAIVSGVWSAILGLVKGAGEELRLAVGVAMEIVGAVLTGAWDRITAGVSGAWRGVTSLVSEALDGIVGTVTGMPGRIASAAAGMWDGIKDAFRSAINWIIDKWNALRFPSASFRIPHVPGTNIGGDITVGGWELPNIQRLHSGGVVPGGPRTEVLRLLQGGETVFTGDQMTELGRVIAGALQSAPTGRGDIGEMNVYPRSSAREFLDEGVWRVAG